MKDNGRPSVTSRSPTKLRNESLSLEYTLPSTLTPFPNVIENQSMSIPFQQGPTEITFTVLGIQIPKTDTFSLNMLLIVIESGDEFVVISIRHTRTPSSLLTSKPSLRKALMLNPGGRSQPYQLIPGPGKGHYFRALTFDYRPTDSA